MTNTFCISNLKNYLSEFYFKGVDVNLKSEVLIAIFSLVGTLAGTFGGIITSSRLTAYRIEQLEKKVDVHNHFATKIPILEEKIKVVNHRLEDLEKELIFSDENNKK